MERAPAVAGQFYPADEGRLRADVRRLLGARPSDERALAVVAPHAGYVYSGEIAGEVFANVHIPDRVILLCPNHTGLGARAAIMSEGAWLIPGHRVPIAHELAEALRVRSFLIEDEVAHAREHSLEVMLPFLVERNPDVQIVPICLSHLPLDACTRLGSDIAETVREMGGEILIVASSDMSHYVPAETARERDTLALAELEAMRPEELYRTVERERISMCGFIPATVALSAALELGAREGKLLRYGNSGETSGDFSQVVGYAGVVIR